MRGSWKKLLAGNLTVEEHERKLHRLLEIHRISMDAAKSPNRCLDCQNKSIKHTLPTPRRFMIEILARLPEIRIVNTTDDATDERPCLSCHKLTNKKRENAMITVLTTNTRANLLRLANIMGTLFYCTDCRLDGDERKGKPILFVRMWQMWKLPAKIAQHMFGF